MTRSGTPGRAWVRVAPFVVQEHVGHPKPDMLTFHRSWPKAIKDRVLANWERWAFRTPDPVLRKHASHSTPVGVLQQDR